LKPAPTSPPYPITPALTLPEAVKKFREQEYGWSGEARGRGKFTAPKQALISPWPTRDLYHGSRNDHPFEFIRVFAICRRRFAEVGEAFSGLASPAGFWRREFAPSPSNKRGLCLPPFNFFTASPVEGEGNLLDVYPLPCGGEGRVRGGLFT
jgi:hypothetical protein